MNAADSNEPQPRGTHRAPLREHVATAVRRYIRDLDGCDAENLYGIALRELEIPLFAASCATTGSSEPCAAGPGGARPYNRGVSRCLPTQ